MIKYESELKNRMIKNLFNCINKTQSKTCGEATTLSHTRLHSRFKFEKFILFYALSFKRKSERNSGHLISLFIVFFSIFSYKCELAYVKNAQTTHLFV